MLPNILKNLYGKIFKNIRQKKADSYTYYACIISGILSALCFLYNLCILSLLSSVPFFLTLLYGSKKHFLFKKFFLLTFLRFFTFFAISYSWFACAYPLDFAHISKIGSILLIAALIAVISLIHSAFFAAMFIPVYKFDFFGFCFPFVCSGIYTLSEYLLCAGDLAFPFSFQYISASKTPVFIQSASLFGSEFITFIIIFVNASIAQTIFSFGEKDRKKYIAASFAPILLIANLAYGIYSLNTPHKAYNTASFLVVQSNISSYDKWSGNTDYIFEKNLEIVNMAFEESSDIDFIVLSETVFPIQFGKDSEKALKYRKELERIAAEKNCNVFFGAFYKENGRTYNAVFMADPFGISDSPYLKRKTVPFGESIPFEKYLGHFFEKSSLNLFDSNISPGIESRIFGSEKGKAGALVCFDSFFQTPSRQSASDGAEVLLLLTNDSWYKNSRELDVHCSHNIMRAVETGRTFVCSANNGISCVISDKGKILSSLGKSIDGYILCEAPLLTEKTLYVKIGDIFALVCAIIVLIPTLKEKFFRF